VEGLDGLENLRELILDKNKIKSVGETSFSGLVRLQELHMEENRLRDLTNFSALPNLQRLYLGLNKIQVELLAGIYKT
jgi:Leucine-rich repeat (LRR) protein